MTTEPIVKFRQRMKEGHICLGTAVSLCDPFVSDAMASSVDFLWIDLEHSAMSPETLYGHMLAARARNVAGLVRVMGSATTDIKWVLDAGANGIIVPQVRSAGEVQQIVADCRYEPLGRRGFGPRVPSNYGRNAGPDYIKRANNNIFVAVMIENVEALAALDEILRVPGLDSIVIGPYDLSSSFGMLGNTEHPKVVAAIDTIIAKTRAAGLFIGAGMPAEPDYAYAMAKRGIQWLEVGSDYEYMVKHLEQVMASLSRQLQSG
jgi:2-dehydro-3-deoxyglucarate aldolase